MAVRLHAPGLPEVGWGGGGGVRVVCVSHNLLRVSGGTLLEPLGCMHLLAASSLGVGWDEGARGG